MTGVRATDTSPVLDPFTVMTSLILEDGRPWADAATDLQLADARAAITGEAPYSFWTRSRGYAKTSDAAGVALAHLLAAPPGARCYWLAADQEQGTLALDSIRGYSDRTPLLRGSLDVQAKRVLCNANGASLEILPADGPGSWGIRPYLVCCDELSAWGDSPAPRRLWESVSSAVAKLHNARLLVVTSSGDPRHWSYKVLEHARTSPMWRTSEPPGPSPWMDRNRLAEQKARLPEPVYAALFMNQWIEAEGAFLDPGAVARAFVLPGPSAWQDGCTYTAALDIGLVNDRTVLAVGHRDPTGVTSLDHMQVWKGTKARPVSLGDVRDAIIRAHDRFTLRSLHFDPWNAHRLSEELRGTGLRCEPFNFTSASKQHYSAALLQSLNEGTLHLYEPGGLQDELRALTIRTTGSGWAFDHGRSGHDDMAVALSMVVLGLSTRSRSRATAHSGLPPLASEVDRRDASRYMMGHTFVGSKHLDLPQPGQGKRPRGFDPRREAGR